MAYDEGLAERIDELVGDRLEVKKMFGGLCYLDRGNMAFGIISDELMVRTGPEAYAAALEQAHAREMDFTGRALKGMIYVASEGLAEDEDLQAWVDRGLAFTGSLPAKDKTARKKTTKKKAAKKITKKKAAKKTTKKKAGKKA